MTEPRRGMLRGAEVVRHHGDPAGEWRAATEGAALRDRSHRRRWAVTGRQPGPMLSGIVTGRMPGPWTGGDTAADLPAGRAEYSVVLTPKGRTISDLRLWRDGGAPGDDAPLLLDVPVAGAEALRAHLGRFLPPRLAKVTDVSGETAMVSVLGPDASALLAREATGLRLEAGDLDALAEGDLRAVDVGGGRPLLLIRCGEVSEPAWDVVGDSADVASIRRRLETAGVRPVGSGVWEALRLEAGRPAFGADLTEEHIPVEAGVHDRAIDYEKGCYTGQEVIVRIRDRGHVNRLLRRLRLGDAPVPAAGTELWRADGEKVVGVVTSGATSPRLGTLALGYVRREVEPPGPVRLGAADGPEIELDP
ncbi:MAG: glycine cleavage T C-terminal barrel domain-containing protein [Longimicrobiales bacterium]